MYTYTLKNYFASTEMTVPEGKGVRLSRSHPGSDPPYSILYGIQRHRVSLDDDTKYVCLYRGRSESCKSPLRGVVINSLFL